MKRRELIRHLEEHGCMIHREGSSHTIYTRANSGHKEAIPRHSEIKRHLARSICRNLNVPVPKGA
ncbi:MAG: type II toxin-antitoxin system HicA family toxin [Prosthecobacter sp.]